MGAIVAAGTVNGARFGHRIEIARLVLRGKRHSRCSPNGHPVFIMAISIRAKYGIGREKAENGAHVVGQEWTTATTALVFNRSAPCAEVQSPRQLRTGDSVHQRMQLEHVTALRFETCSGVGFFFGHISHS